MDKADNTADQIECVNTAYDYWDKNLNENFKKAKAACEDVDDPAQCSKDLLKAQRLWIQYKEAMAPVIMKLNGGGSLSRLTADIFLAEETKKQSRALGSDNDQ